MDHKLSVLVQVDLDGRSVCLLVTGCVTEANQHALYPVIRRARTLTASVSVSVDLTAAAHVEAAAVDLLRWAVDHDDSMGGAGPVQIFTAAPLPEHPMAPTRTPCHRKARGRSPA